MTAIDINADMGESFGPYTIGSDAALLDIVTSANVACGFHGGDPLVMYDTLLKAKAKGVGVGAHPGFNDLWGFGRRQIRQDPVEIERMLVYQVGAIQGMAKAVAVPVTHYKIHGALGNMAAVDPELGQAAARALKAVAPDLIFVVLPGSELERAGAAQGLKLAREIFADRAYDDAGMLVSRSLPGAMIEDPSEAAERMVRFVQEGAVTSQSGKRIPMPIDTLCVHGDGPHAVDIARAVRSGLEASGVEIRPMAAALY